MSTTDNTSTDKSDRADGRKPGVVVFRAGDDADSLHDSDIMERVLSPAAAAGMRGLYEAGFPAGRTTRVLFNAPGFLLIYAWFKSDLPVPIHAHNADCLYYIIAGQITQGTRVLEAGDGFFVPANRYYSFTAGPDGVEVLEFRHANRFDFQARDGTPQYWARLAERVSRRVADWETETPPPRLSSGSG